MILAAIFSFLLGIAIGSWIHFTVWFCVVLAVLSVGLLVFSRYSHAQVLFLVSIIFAGFLVGVVRVNVSNLYQESKLVPIAEKKITLEGIVVDEPDIREMNTKLTVKLDSINEKILLTVPLYPAYSYGDRIKFTTTLKAPESIDSPDGRTFDYSGYLRVRGIWYIGNTRQIELVSSGHGAYIKSVLFKIKHVFTSAIDNVIPQPESSLMSGLLLGTKQSLGKELLTEFQRSGTSHIVVLSGYNIAIVAESIMAVLVFLPKTTSFGIGALSIILFTILSGGGASAWRAAIMVLVALSAKKLNRQYKASRALGFAVCLMLAPNPLLLIFDPSFQLSILATIGIVFVTPYVEPYLKRVTQRFGLKEIISTTIATQIVVLPYLIYNTGLLSLVSLPVNILILGTIPTTMLLGFATGIVGLVSFYLSFIPAFLAYALLWYQLTVIHLGATIPFGAITIPSFSPVILVCIYSIVFLGFYFLKKKQRTR